MKFIPHPNVYFFRVEVKQNGFCLSLDQEQLVASHHTQLAMVTRLCHEEMVLLKQINSGTKVSKFYADTLINIFCEVSFVYKKELLFSTLSYSVCFRIHLKCCGKSVSCCIHLRCTDLNHDVTTTFANICREIRLAGYMSPHAALCSIVIVWLSTNVPLAIS